MPVLSWTTIHVGKWLRAIGHPGYVSVFAEQRVNGSTLLNITDEVLDDMQISESDAEHIMSAIEDLSSNSLRALNNIAGETDVDEITQSPPKPTQQKGTVISRINILIPDYYSRS